MACMAASLVREAHERYDCSATLFAHSYTEGKPAAAARIERLCDDPKRIAAMNKALATQQKQDAAEKAAKRAKRAAARKRKR